MNIPAIRAALERLKSSNTPGRGDSHDILRGLIAVGLRACDEFGKRKANAHEALAAWNRVVIISDILREAGVEVEG